MSGIIVYQFSTSDPVLADAFSNASHTTDNFGPRERRTGSLMESMALAARYKCAVTLHDEHGRQVGVVRADGSGAFR